MFKRIVERGAATVPIVIGVAVVVLAAACFAGYRYHETPQFCATCHLMEPYLLSWTGERVDERTGEPLLVRVHAEAEEETACLDCHEPTIKQQVDELLVYVKDEYRDPLRQRKFPSDDCFACHEHESREAIIELTADYQITYNVSEQFLTRLAESSDYNLEEHKNINPHEWPVDTENVNDPHAEGGPLPDCYRCHSMHRDSVGIDYCFSCHHSGTFATCNTCHEDRRGEQ